MISTGKNSRANRVTVISPGSNVKKRGKNLAKMELPEDSSVKNDIPGLSLIFDKSQTWVSRIFWMIFLSTCASICVYQAYDRIVFYLGEPLRTDIEILRIQYIKFPSVTICPGSGQYSLLINKIKNISKNKNMVRCAVRLADLLEHSAMNITQLWKLSSITKNIFAGFVMQNMNNIQPKQIVEVTDTILGRCQTYNFPNPINFYEFKTILTVTVQWTNLCPTGTNTATIHPEEDDPYMYYNILTDSAKSSDSIYYPMKLTIYKRISLKRRSCADKFTVSACQHECYTEAIGKIISCRTPHINLTNIPYCESKKSLEKLYTDIFWLEKNFNIYSNCSYCKLKCQEYIYSANRGSTKSPVFYSAQHYHFENNLVYVITENLAYPLVNLLCDMGGNIGLYLGLCLVTIAQLLQHMFWGILRVTVPVEQNNSVRKIFTNRIEE